jgi:hypothetical protein
MKWILTAVHLTDRLFPRNIIQFYRTYIHSVKLCREDSFQMVGDIAFTRLSSRNGLAAVKDSLVEKG